MRLTIRLLGFEALDIELGDSGDEDRDLSLGGTTGSDRIGFGTPPHHPDWDTSQDDGRPRLP